MEHKFKLDSVDAMVVVDALDVMAKDGEINENDRAIAKKTATYIVNKVIMDFRERGENGSKAIS